MVVNKVNNQKILVIGVVGRDMLKSVSKTNLSLCGTLPITASTGVRDFADCQYPSMQRAAGDKITGDVSAGEPVLVTAALIRAAELNAAESNLKGFDRIVVMAQMPHTDAEVLATRVWAKLRATNDKSNDEHQVDIVISEAQFGYETSNLDLNYLPDNSPSSKMTKTHPATVLTPVTSYSPSDGVFPGAVSRATIKSNLANQDPEKQYSIVNRSSGIFDPNTQLNDNVSKQKSNKTTVSLLLSLMPNQYSQPRSKLEEDALKSRTVMMLLEDLQKAATPRADVVLFQSRDILLDQIGANYTESGSNRDNPKFYGYTDYHVCNGVPAETLKLCQLRIALDRIFWKGDYIEFVAMTGKNLKNILDLSKTKSDERADLQDKDITGEWLISYGIVQSSLSNLTQISQNNEPLWIPVDPACKGESITNDEQKNEDGEKVSQSVYCIGGTPIADDAYYWILTTDQLAQDKDVYGTLQALPAEYHRPSKSFINYKLASYLQDHMQDPNVQYALTGIEQEPQKRKTDTQKQQTRDVAEYPVTKSNVAFQQRPLLQVDFAKVIASFAAREPVGGNSFVASAFEGVSDARASAPSQQELDLELGNRITGNLPKNALAKNLPPMSIGIQSAFAYDRSVLGNLSPNKQIVNPSFTLNNLTVGGFLQLRLDGMRGTNNARPVRSLPRDLLVFTPHQYQVQVNNSYLFFAYTEPTGITPPAEQLTVTLPRNSSWTDRVGFRREFGQDRAKSFFQNGSYIEGGMEFSVQENDLSSITLQNGATTKTCHVSSAVTLSKCFYTSPPAQFLISSETTLVGAPAMKELHTPGAYWNMHVQNVLYRKGDKVKVSLVTESQGDYFFGRPGSAELSTQTNYAIPLSVAVVFPSFGNLSFAPTYSGFYYKSQLSNQSLQVNSISIAARWYFARDARVPVLTQRLLPGPLSADQTKTGKGH